MSRVHTFSKSLKIGKAAELKFLAKFAEKLEPLEGKGADFKILKDGCTIELKTDSYDPKVTENFFMERFSYDDKPGGPWQALEKGTTYFVYWFPVGAQIYVFRNKDLVNVLNTLTKGYKLCNINNKGFVTQGYKVPRSLLKHIQLKIEDIL